MFGIFGRFGFLGRFGILGIILLPPEFARGRIGPEGVCEAYGGRGVEEKCFFAKRTHFKTSDFQLTNCSIRRYEIYRRSGIGFVIGFDWVCLAEKATGKPSKNIHRELGGQAGGKWSTGLTVLCSKGTGRNACRYLNTYRYLTRGSSAHSCRQPSFTDPGCDVNSLTGIGAKYRPSCEYKPLLSCKRRELDERTPEIIEASLTA